MINLINGECLTEIKKMSASSVDVSFTSPPYNRKRNDKYANYTDIKNDYFSWLCECIDEMKRVTRGNIFFNIQKNYYNKQDVFKLIGHYAESIVDIIIWEKSNPMPASGFNITNAYEFIIVFGSKLSSNKTYTKNHFTTSTAKMHRLHKAVMHPEACEFVIKNFTQEGDLVLDCFSGLGTTGIFCKKLNRNFTGIELDETYHNIAKERISQIML